MAPFDKLVVVTKKTALQELIERFNTREQARFYIEHMGGDFNTCSLEDAVYRSALDRLRATLPRGVRTQWIDRAFLPTFTFGAHDVIVTVGPDGLVVNTAKYLDGQPLIAVNPDPERIDGVLLPFGVADAPGAIALVQTGGKPWAPVAMARAELNDGQTLLAVNDLFVGQKTHASARYLLKHAGREEAQSSSGVIITTGAGSTGWYRSILTGAAGVVQAIVRARGAMVLNGVRDGYRFPWDSDYLVFSVREPFISKTSGGAIVHGQVRADTPLEIVSRMPQNGVIFSDGVEEDFLPFNTGATARIGLAEQRLNLVVPAGPAREGPGAGPVATSWHDGR